MKTNKTNNATINNSNLIKEESIMTTLTKEELRKELSNKGIELSNSQFKKTKKEELIKMLETQKEISVIVSVGDMSEDTYIGDINPAPKFVIDRKHGDYIVKNIVNASFVATKGDSKGKRILTMHKLFGIIRKAYTNNLNDKLEEAFIKDIINQLVKLHYIGFKKYESGAVVFYPTTKAAKYVAR